MTSNNLGQVTIRLAQPQSEADWRHARRLVEEYAASLGLDLSFQNFAHEVEHLAGEYASPAGAFLLAEEASLPRRGSLDTRVCFWIRCLP